MSINIKHMASLFREDLVTVQVVFNSETSESAFLHCNAAKPYTYKALEAHNLKVGDFVAVLANNEIKVVRVIKVDASPQIDVASSYDYKWIIQKIDTSWNEKITAQEAEFTNVLRDMERQAAREKVRQTFLETLPENSPLRDVLNGAVKSLNSVVLDVQPAEGEVK